ncbi:MAG TPA: hypothetical protein DEH78_12220 [Solibacterales bacterium]|nr:hypothetical protein [Bryobacterales bacterium]
MRAARPVPPAWGGGCRAPSGAHAAVDGDRLHLLVITPGPVATRIFRDAAEGLAGEAQALGAALAERMLQAGAQSVLELVYGS